MNDKQIRPAISAFLLMITMSILTTGISFCVAPVCEDLGFSRASFMLYYSFLVAAGAISPSFLGVFINKYGTRGVVLFSSIWCGLGFAGLSISSQLWMFYIFGAAVGLLGATCVFLAANIIVQTSYSRKKASFVLGIVMTGTGVGGVIWSNLIPNIIDSMGWRFGYLTLGIIWVALTMLSVLILGKRKAAATPGHTAASADNSFSRKALLKDRKFTLAIILMCVITVGSCATQHLPSILTEMGHDTARISTLVSVMTASSAIGAILEGMICSKIGIKKTLFGVLLLYIFGFCLMSMNAGVFFALAFLAMGAGSQGTLMPIVVRTLFGNQNYTSIWSVVVTCSSIASFLASPSWGMVYDVTGSYRPALMVMPLLLVCGLLCLVTVFRNVDD